MKNPKLNQVVAAAAGKKKSHTETITECYHFIQKPALFDGIEKTYRPKDEVNGDKLAGESKRVQARVGEMLEKVSKTMVDMIDTVATQDWGNCKAVADIKINDEILAERVPVTHLLWLHHQLTDLETFITKLPTLDPAEVWDHDAAQDLYATRAKEAERTKKVTKFVEVVKATEEHPAQVKEVTDDQIVGTWSTIKYSGAVSTKEKNQMLDRVRRLLEAILKAREEANLEEVEPTQVGKKLLKYVFGK
ncbi:hypothetical protein C4577_02270 [Candidatus Parcubacteria bacterium]|nr:MAG: hypothetical protein C4577_02270 [Candidatus Parcubacteria bacterium]